ncbi:o-succinylbenzoate--CoA ligase [Endozoicomonas montiporae]|uniref:O-succinylbenzoate-CoA ligase n=1 Tax=Endozoicomonas montiporae CL-33 TaxID=570277 RepID=A0A142BEV2_9GAMM|nr:o-succinylbenzoate--CoA ligase [Endozoicomonas montiporae]AMO57278.1 O-succinylbenzoate-CoA ligase [Endozoicomonas montiporae CL-33]
MTECPLRKIALISPDHRVMQINDRPVSALQLDVWVEAYRQQLAPELSIGDRLLVLLQNKVETVVVILACLRSGWVYCPVNPAHPESRILEYADRVGAQAYVSDNRFHGNALQQVGKPELLASPVSVKTDIPVDNDRIFDLIPTSGTTGVPKAVAHSLDNHLFSARGSAALIELTAEDGWLLSLPLFHVGGFSIVIRCLLAGAAILIDQQGLPLSQLLMSLPVTHSSMVNTQLQQIVVSQGMDLAETGLKYILLGGGVASASLVRRVQDRKIRVLTTYGMTEMSSQVCTGVPIFTPEGVTSGDVLPFRRVKIADDGEILVAGKPLCLGYYSQSDEKSGRVTSVADDEGWFHTGDLGEWYESQLRVLGRKDNMMISGGENIHPEEIEQALLTCKGVLQAVVVAVADEKFGQRPFAFVQMVNETVDETFTKGYLAGKIARFKIPDHIVPLPEKLPPEFSGQTLFSGIKPNRRLLQALAECHLS